MRGPIARRILVLAGICLLVICLVVPTVLSLYQSEKTANRTNVIAQQVEVIARQTQTLLTNGKTASAVSAKKTELLVEDLKILITTGKTAGAEASKRAAAATEKALALLGGVQTTLQNEITHNHITAVDNHYILCTIAGEMHLVLVKGICP